MDLLRVSLIRLNAARDVSMSVFAPAGGATRRNWASILGGSPRGEWIGNCPCSLVGFPGAGELRTAELSAAGEVRTVRFPLPGEVATAGAPLRASRTWPRAVPTTTRAQHAVPSIRALVITNCRSSLFFRFGGNSPERERASKRYNSLQPNQLTSAALISRHGTARLNPMFLLRTPQALPALRAISGA